MTSRKKAWLLVGTIFVIILGVLIFLGPKMYLKLLEKRVDKISIMQTRIRENFTEMNVKVDLSEKWIPALIDSMSYSTEIYGKTIASGITRLDPEKRKVRSLVFPVRIENEVLKDEIKKHQGDSTEVKMYISQFVNIPFFKTKSVDVVKVVHMKIPIIPEVRIKGVEMVDFGLNDMGMLVTLSF